ncbi:MAG: PE domain-containing protein, partial [Mycobacterium sp.]
MSFLTTIPQELLAAAAQLEGIGTSLTAQNAAAAAPTTAIAPAASDQVSQIQAGIFAAYGTLYQQIAAEAQAIQQQFVQNLGLSSGTYTTMEAANAAAANASAAGSPADNLVTQIGNLSTFLGGPLFSSGGQPLSLSGNSANFISFESGNWASAMSTCLGMAGGGLVPTDWWGGAAAADVAAGAAGAADISSVAPMAGGMGGMPVAALGQATLVGSMSAPPSWASAAPFTSTAAGPLHGT